VPPALGFKTLGFDLHDITRLLKRQSIGLAIINKKLSIPALVVGTKPAACVASSGVTVISVTAAVVASVVASTRVPASGVASTTFAVHGALAVHGTVLRHGF
jgi:hypothetical protein